MKALIKPGTTAMNKIKNPARNQPMMADRSANQNCAAQREKMPHKVAIVNANWNLVLTFRYIHFLLGMLSLEYEPNF
jgi:hypothetical protein